jgi:hypothetical protein
VNLVVVGVVVGPVVGEKVDVVAAVAVFENTNGANELALDRVDVADVEVTMLELELNTDVLVIEEVLEAGEEEEEEGAADVGLLDFEVEVDEGADFLDVDVVASEDVVVDEGVDEGVDEDVVEDAGSETELPASSEARSD